ncbi:MAG: hypothetical protein PVJ53_02835 [Desulfobacterales bacterium]|jgi:hypothetical protein
MTLGRFQQALAAPTRSRTPQDVAEAAVMETPAGQRRFRTAMDQRDLGEPIQGTTRSANR